MAATVKDVDISWDPVGILPEEITNVILSYLLEDDFCHLACCRKRWREATNVDDIWLQLCKLKDWERFGGGSSASVVDLRKEKPYKPSTSNRCTFQTDTIIGTEVMELAPTCKWKEVYMRAWHLEKNWAEGRFQVQHLPLCPEEREDCETACFSCDGETVGTADDVGNVRLWDLHTGQFLRLLNPANSLNLEFCYSCCLVIKKNVGLVATGHGIIAFEVSTGLNLKVFEGDWDPENTGPKCLFFEGGKILATIMATNHDSPEAVYVWDFNDPGKRKRSNDSDSSDDSEDEDEDEPEERVTWVMSSCSDGLREECRYLRTNISCLAVHGYVALTMQYSGYGAEEDPRFDGSTCKLWNTKTRQIVRSYKGHSKTITCGHMDETTIITGDESGEVKIWDVKADNTCKYTLQAGNDTNGMTHIRFNDKVIVALTNSPYVIIWNSDGVLLHKHFTDKIFSRDLCLTQNRLVVTGSKQIALWDITTGKLMRRVEFERELCCGPDPDGEVNKTIWMNDTKIVLCFQERKSDRDAVIILNIW